MMRVYGVSMADDSHTRTLELHEYDKQTADYLVGRIKQAGFLEAAEKINEVRDTANFAHGMKQPKQVCVRCHAVSPVGEYAPPGQCAEGSSDDPEHDWR